MCRILFSIPPLPRCSINKHFRKTVKSIHSDEINKNVQNKNQGTNIQRRHNGCCKTIPRYFTFKKHLLSEPFIVLCFPSRATTMEAFVSANGIIFIARLPFTFSLSHHHRMWFILIFLDFNFQRFVLSLKHSPHKRSETIAFMGFCGTTVDNSTLSYTTYCPANSHNTPPPCC